ncbi:MAG: GNAT family N-acetyltransferase [Actinomycetes bacterium]
MLLRPEEPADVDAVRALHLAAFDRPELEGSPAVEARLVDALRDGGHLLPAMTLVAVDDDAVVGHVAASRATVDGAPVVALGPIGVLPAGQRRGTGSSLVTALLTVADRAGEPAVVLLGDPAFYGRFGFEDSRVHGVLAPDPSWGVHFQLRPLTAWRRRPLHGTAHYAPPFDDL